MTYSVPSMAEIAKVKGSNGFTMVSTFSGCGGSCLGFEMAGFNLLWANEFIAEARNTYRANHPGVILTEEDIRQITAEEILKTLGLEKGELDLFEGSPPCSSFSTAGVREKAWGKVKKNSDSEQQADDLFFEYSRLVEGLQPKVFIAENVTGLVKGKAIGYFKLILKELKAAGYTVEAKILDASYLGVPQARQRLILIGVRNDLVEKFGVKPEFPKPFTYRYSYNDAVATLDKPKDPFIDPETGYSIALGNAVGKEWENLKEGGQSEKYFQLVKPYAYKPIGTITASGGNVGLASITHPYEKRKFNLKELRRVSSFPDDFELTGTFAQRWERIGRSVPPLMAKAIAETIRDSLLRKVTM